jgi:triosephosphate isomerase (TIM)
MKLIIAANWKMHKTAAETAAFCREILKDEGLFKTVDVLICPPFTALHTASEALKGSEIKLGAQNMSWEEGGAYTGEVSAAMLLDLGVQYVIIGHSERRHIMGEDDRQVNLKVKRALLSGLKPILCLGETEEERTKGATEVVLENQLEGGLAGLTPDQVAGLVIAYEPVWAIGTGKAATADDAEKAGAFILSRISDKIGPAAAGEVRIQYGGSVKADNIGSFVSLPSVAGALVGGASLDAGSFSALIQAARKAVLH